MFEAVAATLPAADIDRAIAFYRDQLGLEPSDRGGDGSATYEVGSTVLMVYPSAFAGTNQATAAGFEVTDIDATVGQLRGRGVTFEDLSYGEVSTVEGIMTMPDGTRGAWFKDTEGNVLGVFQRAA